MRIETRSGYLHTALMRVLPAIGEDGYTLALRPMLNTVEWVVTPTRLVLRAADGYVLAEAEVDMPIVADGSYRAALPAPSMRLLARELGREGFYTIVITTDEDDGRWRFDIEDTALYCAPVIGKAINYDKAWKRANWPTNDDGVPTINGNYLRVLTEHAPHDCTIATHGRNGPIVISGRHYRAVIMPMTTAPQPIASLLGGDDAAQ